MPMLVYGVSHAVGDVSSATRARRLRQMEGGEAEHNQSSTRCEDGQGIHCGEGRKLCDVPVDLSELPP
jgi:hypothetical protein